MEFKLVISDPETGKSYNKAIKDSDAAKLTGKIIGEDIDGSLLGLSGYTLRITGGSDKSGFPMKKGVHKPVERVLMSKGVGYNPLSKVRRRKRVRGEIITTEIVQVNTIVTKKGSKTIAEILGIKEEEKPATEKKSEKPKEEKPAEKPKTEEKKVEKSQEMTEKKQEKPTAEKKEDAKEKPKEEKHTEKPKTEGKSADHPKDEKQEKPKA